MGRASEQLSIKVKELETKLNKLNRLFFSYHIATMKYLKDKGVVNPSDLPPYIAEAKKEIDKLNDDIDFFHLFKDWPNPSE